MRAILIRNYLQYSCIAYFQLVNTRNELVYYLSASKQPVTAALTRKYMHAQQVQFRHLIALAAFAAFPSFGAALSAISAIGGPVGIGGTNRAPHITIGAPIRSSLATPLATTLGHGLGGLHLALERLVLGFQRLELGRVLESRVHSLLLIFRQRIS